MKTKSNHKFSFASSLFIGASSIVLSTVPGVAHAQNSTTDNTQQKTESGDEIKKLDTVVVTGIRQALSNALTEKREQNNIVEVINAEDVGKLPDQNLAEVLENITGVQITRDTGVGSSVQIRGASENRIEINGVGTVPAGDSRTGISFEDVPAALIASLEVTKVPTAKHVEGSVGGTINLRTRKGLDLKEPLFSIRAQTEHSDLSDTWSPTISGTAGNAWSSSIGEFGGVLSFNWNKTDVVQFQPRFDRDRVVLSQNSIDSLTALDGQGFAVPNFSNTLRGSAEDFNFLRVQFLQQAINNLESERVNLTGSLEYAPSDELKFFVEGTFNQNERTILRNEAHFSGTGGNGPVDNTTNSTFEEVNLGSIDGPTGSLNLGSIFAVETGVVGVGGQDPNLRAISVANSRFTDNTILSGGANWEKGRLKADFRASYSVSESETPRNSITLDFINPNSTQPAPGVAVDNGTPAAFDTRDDTLSFGVAFGADSAPTVQDLLTPANYELRSVGVTFDTNKNEDKEARFDLEYDVADQIPFLSSIDFGMRWNSQSSDNNDSRANTNYTSRNFATFRANGADFQELLVPGYDNFGDADDRDLFIKDYLVLDVERLLNDPNGVVDVLTPIVAASNAANGTNLPSPGLPTENQAAFYDISEETLATYLQANFAWDINNMPIRGNVGVRHIKTDVTADGVQIINSAAGEEVLPISGGSSYDMFLPRASIVFEPTEKLVLRAGAAKDIRRPNFSFLSPSLSFGQSPEARVNSGNPTLEPQEIESFDLSAEYYLSDTSFFSVGFFHKTRKGVFGLDISNAIEEPGAGGQIERDITAPCEQGGIFNPFANRGVYSSVDGQGICVDFGTRINEPGETENTGVEFAFQYDLASFEDQLGWASGFGIITNLTLQESKSKGDNFWEANGDANSLNLLLGRVDDPFNPVTTTTDDDLVFQVQSPRSLSEESYNITLFYEKYNISARTRYTWRSEFFTGEFQSFDLPRIIDARGQLNANISYDLTDQIQIQAEGVNLLREDRAEYCVNAGTLLCDQGLSDRRLTFGVRYTY